MGADRGDGIHRSQPAVDDPRLSAGLGRGPAGKHSEKPERRYCHGEELEPTCVVETILPPQYRAGARRCQQEYPDAHHDAEREEHDRDIWAVIAGDRLEALNLAVPGVSEIETCQMRDLDREAVGFGLHVGPGKDGHRRTAGRVPQPLHRRDFGRLMRNRINALSVADHHLKRREDKRHPHRHRQRDAGGLGVPTAPEMEGRDAGDDEGTGNEARTDHMCEAIGE